MYPDFYNNPIRVQACKEHIKRGGMPVIFCHSEPCSGFTEQVTDELHKFDLALNGNNDITLYGYVDILGNVTDWTLPVSSILPGSVRVFDSFNPSTEYQENIDWVMPSTGIIRRIPTGGIEDLDYVSISYSWYERCIDEKTKSPKPHCPVCGGLGQYVTTEQWIIGVLNIPQYRQPWMEEGFWKEGDAILGIDPDIHISAEPRDHEGFMVRDIIKLQRNGKWQEWWVMSLPQSTQMNGDYLAQSLQLRLKDPAANYGVV